MRIYAFVDAGIVRGIFQPGLREDGTQWLIEECLPAEVAATYVEITGLDPQPQEWWTASHNNGVWEFSPYVAPTDPLPVLAENKRNYLRDSCSEEITRSSFQSSALGAVHNYDCRLVDQINLKMRFDIAEASGSTEPLWASDGTRYQWKLHTAEEILDVMVDMNIHIKDAQVKLASLMASVDAATTKAQIEAIVW